MCHTRILETPLPSLQGIRLYHQGVSLYTYIHHCHCIWYCDIVIVSFQSFTNKGKEFLKYLLKYFKYLKNHPFQRRETSLSILSVFLQQKRRVFCILLKRKKKEQLNKKRKNVLHCCKKERIIFLKTYYILAFKEGQKKR